MSATSLHKLICVKTFIFLLYGTLMSQTVIVKDINANTGWSDFEYLFEINDITYFVATSSFDGRELWKSDGTEEGTVMLKDIHTGFDSSNPSSFYEHNGIWFFSANNGVNGIELWRTDGTTAGTILIKDIFPGSSSSIPSNFHSVEDQLYFVANDGTNGIELWRTDGTSSGTVLVEDINPGAASSSPSKLTALNSTLFFSAESGNQGRELWKANSVANNTTIVKDIRPGSTGSFPEELKVVNNALFFTADDGTNGREIWRSTGSEATTNIVQDIKPGAGSSSPLELTAIGNTLFFSADDGTNGVELWMLDASTATPVVTFKDIKPQQDSSLPTLLYEVGNTLFFNANDGLHGYELWKSDGTVSGTSMVKDINDNTQGFTSSDPMFLTSVGNNLYFAANDGEHGFELWRSNGTSTGTFLLRDINTNPAMGFSDSNPTRTFVSGDTLYFSAFHDVKGWQIWQTLGSAATTTMLTDIPRDTIFNNLYIPYFVEKQNNSIFFVAFAEDFGEELWRFDQQPFELASINATSMLSCNGAADGSIEVILNGGIGSQTYYEYEWSDPALDGGLVENLPAGTYSVTITDCGNNSVSTSITIDEPTVLVGGVTEQGISCGNENDGQAEAGASGGTDPYTYLWETGNETALITGLTTGSYDVTITDANGCSIVQTAIIDAADNLQITSQSSNISCFGEADGTAVVTPSGGGTNLAYEWSNGETTQSISNLEAGIYTVTVSANGNCTAETSVEIFEPNELSGVTTQNQAVTCANAADGIATVFATGGTGGVSVLWDNGETTSTASGLDVGIHTVTLTDQGGCTITLMVEIEGATLPLNTTIEALASTSCLGAVDGQASVTSTGGSGTFTYLWDNGEMTATAISLSVGEHFVTITDEVGCEVIESITIDGLTPIVMLLNEPSCNGENDGEAIISIPGSNNTYAYLWDNGDTGATSSNLSGGTHTVVITELETSCNMTIDVFISEPNEIFAQAIAESEVSCLGDNNGQATVVVSGGIPMYDYAWDNGETTATAITLDAGLHTVTITDGNGCTTIAEVTIEQPSSALTILLNGTEDTSCADGNDGQASVVVTGGVQNYTYEWDNGESTSTATQLSPGEHTVLVTDASGCMQMLTVNIGEPDALSANTTLDSEVSCSGGTDGQATVQALGGTGDYTYEWSNGETTATATNLPEGDNTVITTDTNGCTFMLSVNVTVSGDGELTASIIGAMDISCAGGNDGEATVVVSGNGPFTYEWSNGETNSTATQLQSGINTVVVSNENGCSVISEITINEPDDLLVGVTTSTPASGTNTDGSATITPSGGQPPYTYVWDIDPVQYTSTAEDLAVGSYTVTVTDENGCQLIETINVEMAVGFAEIEGLKSFEVFPNPATNESTAAFVFSSPQDIKLELVSILGQQLYQIEDNNILEKNYNLPIQDLSAGVYFIKCTIDNQILLKRLIVAE